ncbi:MAG TPA: M48 family metalloprotease [Desulfopila sp.]|nr:M48 family metalloprotease [Desulfopila sp.]
MEILRYITRESATLFSYGVVILLLAGSVGCEDTNVFMLVGAGTDAVNAITLDDEEVRTIATEAAALADEKHTVAPPDTVYSKRLQKLIAEERQRGDHRFNFRVYLSDEVNAFAMADGTVRIYSGLMDLMDDDELLFVIGHEMGHVAKEHSRKKVVLAYASSALRKGLASQENEIGMLARSALGGFVQQLTNAQFSQHEEKQADTFGAEFLLEKGHSIVPAVSALRKLEDQARHHTFLSSHPAPGDRVERLASGAFKNDDDGKLSLVARLLARLTGWLAMLIDFVLSFF